MTKLERYYLLLEVGIIKESGMIELDFNYPWAILDSGKRTYFLLNLNNGAIYNNREKKYCSRDDYLEQLEDKGLKKKLLFNLDLWIVESSV